MRLLTITFICAWIPLALGQSITRLPLTETTHVVNAFTSYGFRAVDAAVVIVDITSIGGGHERGQLTTVFDKENGHYFWRITIPFSQDEEASVLSSLGAGVSAVYASPESLVYFNGFWVQEHREKAFNLSNAEDAAVDAIRRNLVGLAAKAYDTGLKQIEFHDGAVNDGFSCPELATSAICRTVTRFISINKTENKWRLVMRNRWDMEVILDTNFDVIGSRQLTSPPAGQTGHLKPIPSVQDK
jgi:hypothetical protein